MSLETEASTEARVAPEEGGEEQEAGRSER